MSTGSGPNSELVFEGRSLARQHALNWDRNQLTFVSMSTSVCGAIGTHPTKTALMSEGEEALPTVYYDDKDSFRLVNAVSQVVAIPIEEVWEAYGGFLMQFTMETGWDELLKCMATDLKSFLDNLDNLHYFIDHVVYANITMVGPSFRSEANDDGSITLHYHSKRNGLYPIVKGWFGVVREAARRLFDVDIVMKVSERKQEEMEDGSLHEYVIFHISMVKSKSEGPEINKSFVRRSLISLSPSDSGVEAGDLSFLKLADFTKAFPYHVCFDADLFILHVGDEIKRIFPFLLPRQTKLLDLFKLEYPDMPMSFHNFQRNRNSVFVLVARPHIANTATASTETDHAKNLEVKGQMSLLEGGEKMLYLCSPNVQTVRGLLEHSMHLRDIPMHDATRDLILLNQSRMSQMDLNKKLEETIKQVKIMSDTLAVEKQKTDTLLKELLPASVADALRAGKTVDACEYNESSIVFTDIVGFTTISSKCTPYDVVNLLNDLYLRFDRLVQIHGLYKVETVGDAYMSIAGVPEQSPQHHAHTLNMALGMQWESKQVLKPGTQWPLQIRAGVHSGPVLTGVVGKKMPRFCLFGDTPILANKMESHGVPAKIQLSQATYDLAISQADSKNAFEFEFRGEIDVKGVGKMNTYFLLKNINKSLWEVTQREKPAGASIDGYAELHDTSVFEPPPEPDPKKAKKTKAPADGQNGDSRSNVCAVC